MTFARISSEPGLILDAVKGVVGEEREDLILYSLDEIEEAINKLDEVADDLVNSLNPFVGFRSSYPGRDRTMYHAGVITAMFYGIIVGLIIAFLIGWFKW